VLSPDAVLAPDAVLSPDAVRPPRSCLPFKSPPSSTFEDSLRAMIEQGGDGFGQEGTAGPGSDDGSGCDCSGDAAEMSTKLITLARHHVVGASVGAGRSEEQAEPRWQQQERLNLQRKAEQRQVRQCQVKKQQLQLQREIVSSIAHEDTSNTSFNTPIQKAGPSHSAPQFELIDAKAQIQQMRAKMGSSRSTRSLAAVAAVPDRRSIAAVTAVPDRPSTRAIRTRRMPWKQWLHGQQHRQEHVYDVWDDGTTTHAD
jgi:hypothetical protein